MALIWERLLYRHKLTSVFSQGILFFMMVPFKLQYLELYLPPLDDYSAFQTSHRAQGIHPKWSWRISHFWLERYFMA